jgi:hypothetical protein
MFRAVTISWSSGSHNAPEIPFPSPRESRYSFLEVRSVNLQSAHADPHADSLAKTL